MKSLRQDHKGGSPYRSPIGRSPLDTRTEQPPTAALSVRLIDEYGDTLGCRPNLLGDIVPEPLHRFARFKQAFYFQ